MSNTPEDTELFNKLGELYFSTDDIGHFRQLDSQEISSIMNLITLHTDKAVQLSEETIYDIAYKSAINDITMGGEWVLKEQLITLHTQKTPFPYEETYSFLHNYYKDVLEELEEHLAQLTNPTERSE